MYIYASIFESHVVRGERLVPADRRCLVQLCAVRSAAPDSATPVADVCKARVNTPIAPAGAPGTRCSMQRTLRTLCNMQRTAAACNGHFADSATCNGHFAHSATCNGQLAHSATCNGRLAHAASLHCHFIARDVMATIQRDQIRLCFRVRALPVIGHSFFGWTADANRAFSRFRMHELKTIRCFMLQMNDWPWFPRISCRTQWHAVCRVLSFMRLVCRGWTWPLARLRQQ